MPLLVGFDGNIINIIFCFLTVVMGIIAVSSPIFYLLPIIHVESCRPNHSRLPINGVCSVLRVLKGLMYVHYLSVRMQC